MFSKSLAVGALAAGCVAAAAGGAYVAVRHNAERTPVVASAPATPAGQSAETLRPVAETEAVIEPVASEPVEAQPPATKPQRAAPAARPEKPEGPSRQASRPTVTARPRPEPRTPSLPSAPQDAPRESTPAPPSAREARETAIEPAAPIQAPVQVEQPSMPPTPQFEELVVPASSVVGLRVERSVTSERARLEDRVDASVTRDVMVDGRVAIPAGARAIGAVTLVEQGGKVKERARLGVRFHTLVLADGSELPISTEAILREGESPSGESTRKIGGAAVGGAILGALIGGKKGAIVGGATGAAGGTAVVMAGDRNAATLPSGTVVTIRLAAPVGVEVEKR